MTHSMRLTQLLQGDLTIAPALDAELSGLQVDSRRVTAGDLFLACRGANADGRAFIDDALARGASAVLVEAGEGFEAPALRDSVPVIPVPDLSERLGKLAARFFDHPARELWLVGITGTNGKTSTCQFIAQIYAMLGKRCGVSGTLGYGIHGEPLAEAGGPGTTPDAVAVQRILREVREQRATVMAMEVSSHGLQQARVNVDDFDVAVFTNLSRDHLDYHLTMEAYGAAKQRLFAGSRLHTAVLDLDDPFSAVLLETLPGHVRPLTYALHDSAAELYPLRLEFRPSGFHLRVRTPWGEGGIDSALLGAFNASNLLAALSAVLAGEADKPGFDLARVFDAASRTVPVRGRMEVVGNEPVAVVVDYAHTPDGLTNALGALRQHYQGTVWCVFGCGGERDQGKRPLMARVAEQLADRIVVTDDNPRREGSAAIIQQILAGFERAGAVHVEADRARAIAFAIDAAQPGDVVLIAGKGHEDYQDSGGRRTAFSDVQQARQCLDQRFQKQGG